VYYGIGTPTTLWTTTTATTATITGLNNDTTYYVRLRAKSANGFSDYGTISNNVPGGPGLYRGVEKVGNQNLSASVSYISTNAVTGDNFYIVLEADESVSPMTLYYSGKTVGITLLGYDSERTVTLGSNGSMFTVNDGVTFTLEGNIALVGRSANNASLIQVNSGGSFIMNGGIISENTASGFSIYGGGVYVGSGGTFTMNGGNISGNAASGNNSYGGGVSVEFNGTFTMNGGTISGNTAGNGGGGVRVSSGGTFTIYGGSISGNTASSTYGGGVYVDGTFTMQGGIISGNTSSGYGGGGVFNHGTSRIVAGTIYGSDTDEGLKNTATNGAALNNSGTAQRGTFSGETWVSKGTLSTTNNTIKVVNGELQ